MTEPAQRTLTIIDSDTGQTMVLPIHMPVMGVAVVQGVDKVRGEMKLEFKDASLNSVAVGNSAICFIDGNNSRLFYRGYNINQLAKHGTFPEIAYLLTNIKSGERPTTDQLQAYQEELACNARIPDSIYSAIRLTGPQANPMSVLQMATAAMDEHIPKEESHLILAKMPAVVAGIIRHQEGLSFIPPDRSLSHSANMLNMCFGRYDDASVRAFEVARIVHAEHEMNASTFATMVTASTLASIPMCMASGVGALSGSRHGGANTAVLEMLKKYIPDVKAVGPFLDAVEKGQMKLMGAGHRVYKSDDPRELLIEKETKVLFNALGIEDSRVEILDEIKRQIGVREYFTNPKRQIHANVDFRTGPFYTALGFKAKHLTMLFADARYAGWLGHDYEFLADPENKIVRPRSEHNGPAAREFLPLSLDRPNVDAA